MPRYDMTYGEIQEEKKRVQCQRALAAFTVFVLLWAAFVLVLLWGGR